MNEGWFVRELMGKKDGMSGACRLDRSTLIHDKHIIYRIEQAVEKVHEPFDDVKRMRDHAEITSFVGCFRQRRYVRGLGRRYCNRRVHDDRFIGGVRVHTITDGQNHFVFSGSREGMSRICYIIACIVSKIPYS